MVISYPWTGRDINQMVSISGRAALPGLPNGSGFNWRSMAKTTGYVRPSGMHGLGRVRRLRRGFRGLGQDGSNPFVGTYDVSGGTTPTDPNLSATNPYYATLAAGGLTLPTGTTSATASAAQGSSSAPWYAPLLAAGLSTGSTIASYELNPLYQKSTYIQTPQGQIIATNQPTTGIPGITSATAASFMPLLLIGGGLMVFMMMAKR